jgi:hypothetical protein
MKRIDAGKQFWADFPMVGYNADGLFIDVNPDLPDEEPKLA